jgi:hypothetical protein
MTSNVRQDATYRIGLPPEDIPGASPRDHAPENAFPDNIESVLRQPVQALPQFVNSNRPTSSKEVLHDAPEVVGAWLSQSHRPSSPFSVDETVVSGFPPLGYEEKGELVLAHRMSELPPEKSKICGLPRRYLIGAIILAWVIILAIGLGVGLGVGLKKDRYG